MTSTATPLANEKTELSPQPTPNANLSPPTSTLSGLLEQIDKNGGKNETLPSLVIYKQAKVFIDNFNENQSQDILTLDKLCRYIVWSLDQETVEHSYIACGFIKIHALDWIEHLKRLNVCCLKSMTKLKPELISESKILTILLSTLISFSSSRCWRIVHLEKYANLKNGMVKLSNNIFNNLQTHDLLYTSLHIVLLSGLTRPGKIAFSKPNLQALATLANRPLIESDDSETIAAFLKNILTVPGYIHYVNTICSAEFIPKSKFPNLIDFLLDNTSFEASVLQKDPSLILSLLANLVQIGESFEKLSEIAHRKLLAVILRLVLECSPRESTKRSHWHHVLGWVENPVPPSFLHTVGAVKSQLEALWGPIYIKALFLPIHPHFAEIMQDKTTKETAAATKEAKQSGFTRGFIKAIRRVFTGNGTTPAQSRMAFPPHVMERIGVTCKLYRNLITTFTSCKLDIVSGLCFKESSQVLCWLWTCATNSTTEPAMKHWVHILLTRPGDRQEDVLLTFVDVLTHYITVLDDKEMYETQKVFTLSTLAEMAFFMNNLCFRLISNPGSTKLQPAIWNPLKALTMLLYRRDCRKKFCPDGHWTVDRMRMNQLISDIDKDKKNAKKVLQEMPHVLREEARVILFRKWANSEKQLNGCGSIESDHMLGGGNSTLITIRRGHIVEDGYSQLASLTPKTLKGTIRVRFQNELGLEEAGIDHDGVFKEFLEETISAAFHPSLNLFRTTSENTLYPSPISYLHENHLELFEFVGKILGKAVYEGIVVDVHFAPFFLSQMLGLQQSALLFSAIDELQSFDREIYNSLTYIKHYEGDVKDLELTFSVDQDVFGQIRTIELVPGGRTVPVTNENKINYLYLKAHYHLYLQIKDQTNAFLAGFRSIISNDWLKIFSPPELQRLISGEDSDIDLLDLRRHTQYYGGFHDKHRVILWLWDILENDFNENERRLFLKFVTSCSKPPLLGFVNLDPAFSVRCVEVSEDDDTGDTIGRQRIINLGSVVRGFLQLGKHEPVGRLPTSSTCFNLLKLPNYTRKSTLRDKLKYAVTANVGFELS